MCVQLGEETVDLTPTVSSSIAPNCRCVPLHPECPGSFPHSWFTSVLFFWVLRGFCHVCLYDQVTKEINRNSMFATFCESIFGVFELVIVFGLVLVLAFDFFSLVCFCLEVIFFPCFPFISFLFFFSFAFF